MYFKNYHPIIINVKQKLTKFLTIYQVCILKTISKEPKYEL